MSAAELNDLLKTGKAFTEENAFTAESTYMGNPYVGSFLPPYRAWLNLVGELILRMCGRESDYYEQFLQARKAKVEGNPPHIFWSAHNQILGLLDAMTSLVERGNLSPGNVKKSQAEFIGSVRNICDRFHAVVIALRTRRDERVALDMDDEYDVQYLLRSLLTVSFQDVRPEEWTPSYAGASSKMDFFLKESGIVVEAKKTRKGLVDKQVGEELLIDVARYKQHPGARHLICFVYDPENRIVNPVALSEDIAKQSSEQFGVEVIVAPRR